MGCDVHGFVEIKKYPDSSPDWWTAVINIAALVGRNYGMFGLLFNQRNYYNFKPLQSKPRGLPNDLDSEGLVSKEVKHWGEDAHSHTWVTLSELKKVDWKQTRQTEYTFCYELDINGEPGRYLHGFMSSSEITDDENEIIHSGGTVKKFDKMLNQNVAYRLGTQNASKILSSDWSTLFSIMNTLGDYIGIDNVRMVIWFDN